MKKISVAEYAKDLKISPQSIYQRIKRGGLKAEKAANGITYVIIEEEEIKPDLKPKVESELKSLEKAFKTILKGLKSRLKDRSKTIKLLREQIDRKDELIKKQQKENKQLTKRYVKKIDFLIDKYEEGRALAQKPEKDDIIDLEEVSKKKKSKKKKRK